MLLSNILAGFAKNTKAIFTVEKLKVAKIDKFNFTPHYIVFSNERNKFSFSKKCYIMTIIEKKTYENL